jgi:tetratricopeptide (TPR) repeat protein
MLTRTEFNQSLHRLRTAWSKGDLASAFSEIEKVLREGSAEMKAECLLYRGEIKDNQGELADAKQDWLNALAYSGEGTFLHYSLERCLGQVCETLGLPEEALRWYRTSLSTCSQGDEFSGHRSLTALLRLTGGEVPPEDKPTVASVAEKSWRVLQLPGAPDLNDLVGTVSKLAEGFQKSVDEIVRESDRSAN